VRGKNFSRNGTGQMSEAEYGLAERL